MKVKAARLVEQLRYGSLYRETLESDDTIALTYESPGFLYINFMRGQFQGRRLVVPASGLRYLELFPEEAAAVPVPAAAPRR